MSERACVLCNNSTDDTLQFGEKSTYEDTTAHLYCLLLTSNLVQHGEDDEGISGFMPKDIKAEVSRTKKLLCHYCQGKSATIGCCVKSCRRSFHLPCGLENDCRFEFTNTFRSFCDLHHDIQKPKNAHKPTDLCTVCYDEMGPYNPVRSIPLPCCNKNSWCHKLCLQKYAQTSGYFLKCPLCNDSNQFREFISERGVFIPDRDAKWEVEDSGPNAFYDFEQHSERPSECEAKECKCKRGRKYQVDIEHHRHSLEFCDYCGSHAAHLGCIKGDKYVCEECTVIAAKVESARIASFATQSTSSGISTLGRLGPQSPTFKILAAKYKLRECSVRLPRLTQRELDFALERGNCDYTAASTSTRCSMSSISTVNIQTYTSSSDESKIQPCATHKNRKLSKILLSESDSDEDVAPYKKVRLSSTNSVTSSDMEQLKLKFDINDNSKDVPSSNIAPEICRIQTPNRTNIPLMSAFNPIPNGIYRDNQPSSSEEEQIKPTGLISGKSLAFESSDDQVFGNENEKPGKNVAVVRPFSRNDTSSDSSSIIKPAKIKPRPRKLLSSSDEPFDDFPEAISSPKRDQAATNMETGTKRSIDGTSSVACIKVRLSPSKRKHRSVLSYFRDTTSSSDEEVVEPKSKKKSPKIKSRSPASTIPSNQATIMQFFKKHVSSNI